MSEESDPPELKLRMVVSHHGSSARTSDLDPEPSLQPHNSILLDQILILPDFNQVEVLPNHFIQNKSH